MKKLRITFLLMLVLGISRIAAAQADTTTVDTTAVDITAIDTVTTFSFHRVVIDTTLLVPVSIAEPAEQAEGDEEEQPDFEVIPWEFHAPLQAHLSATDSTLRWQIWPDWTYKLNREPGIISYRMGTSDRSNAVQRHAHEPRHQQLYWEGISLNDPVSGSIDWSFIPQQKIGEFYTQDLGTKHRSTYYQRQYYLNEPLSRLIYNESSFTKRDLEFEVSHNINQRTNIEASYLNRRAGGEYPNSELTGNQIFAKASYHLDPRRYLKLNYINNSRTVGRPFGYAIADHRIFNFNRFSATANQGSAESSTTGSILALSLYQRSESARQGPDDFQSSLYYRGNERTMQYLADSTSYKTRSVGLNTKKWLDIGRLSLEGSGNYEQFFNQTTGDSTLTAPNWGEFNGEGLLSADIGRVLKIEGGGSYNLRTDGFHSYRLSAEAGLKLGGLQITPGASTGSSMPTPQQLYWDSEEVMGQEGLANEQIQEFHAELSYDFNPDVRFGTRVQHKDMTDGIMVVDSSFVNVSPYASQSATAYLEWEGTNFEFDGSATLHQFSNSLSQPEMPAPMATEQRVWLKGSLYWKGYLLNKATYVKAGVSGMMAPFRYQADHYNPVLDNWQPLSNDQLLPIYNRLDIDISARVRSIMFVMRWENVLDDVSQLGYFETAGYPMSQRRFLVGIRALFRN